jgi:hypothetical protein
MSSDFRRRFDWIWGDKGHPPECHVPAGMKEPLRIGVALGGYHVDRDGLRGEAPKHCSSQMTLDLILKEAKAEYAKLQ